MTLKIKTQTESETIEEATCDRCGESIIPPGDIDCGPEYAVLEPSFGYTSGLDCIWEGPNGMRLFFCEGCYGVLLKLLGLEIGCNPKQGYHWKEPDVEVSVTVGDPTDVNNHDTNAAWPPTKFVMQAWPHLDKGVRAIPAGQDEKEQP